MYICKHKLSKLKLRVDLKVPTPSGWIEKVLDDFASFLQDHANCERKASAVATSFVAKYPDRNKIMPMLIDTAIEELEHFREVYAIMQLKGVSLKHEIEEDVYVKELIALCRTGREERFMDRLILASLLECRGAERFKIIYENVQDVDLKVFYHRLWACEAKHAETYVVMALQYFDENVVYKRLHELTDLEGAIMLKQPFTAKMH